MALKETRSLYIHPYMLFKIRLLLTKSFVSVSNYLFIKQRVSQRKKSFTVDTFISGDLLAQNWKIDDGTK